jgi:hypothetical protein
MNQAGMIGYLYGIGAFAARLSSCVLADVVHAVVTPARTQLDRPVTRSSARDRCPAAVTAADPLLVARRHVDFLRIRSAIPGTGR